MMIKRLLLGLMVAAAGAFSAVAIAACDDNDEVVNPDDQEVDIRITDSGLEPDRVEVKAGTIRFLIDNDGDETHELAVETTNEVEESGAIDPGGSTSMTVSLPPGEYAMYDPLENNRERGIEGIVVVRDTTTIEQTVTEEGTDTVIEDTDTETETRRDTDTVTRQETVTQQDQQQTTTAP